MRNVVKGFQTSKVAVPKFHAAKMNSLFLQTHKAPRIPNFRRLPRFTESKPVAARLPSERPFRGRK